MPRRVRLMLICGLIGAAITTVSGWAIATLTPFPIVAVHAASGSGRLRWPVAVPADWPEPTQLLACDRNGMRFAAWSCIEFVQPQTANADTVQHMYVWRQTTVGLPFPALIAVNGYITSMRQPSQHHSSVSITRGIWQHGVNYPQSIRFGWNNSPMAMPIRPVWWGFILNTLVYGGLTFVIWRTPPFLRRRRRRRKGRCLDCGYDLAGLAPPAACPECGAASTTPHPQQHGNHP